MKTTTLNRNAPNPPHHWQCGPCRGHGCEVCQYSGRNPNAKRHSPPALRQDTLSRCEECQEPSNTHDGLCYECQCKLHAIGAYDMDN